MRRNLPRILPVAQRIRRHPEILGRFRDPQKVLKVFHDSPSPNPSNPPKQKLNTLVDLTKVG